MKSQESTSNQSLQKRTEMKLSVFMAEFSTLSSVVFVASVISWYTQARSRLELKTYAGFVPLAKVCP